MLMIMIVAMVVVMIKIVVVVVMVINLINFHESLISVVDCKGAGCCC